MKNLQGLACVLTLLFSYAGAAHAQNIYSCKDANGRTITSDLPIPECAGRENRLLNKDGSTKEVIPAPLTPEQKRAREAEDARKKQEEQDRLEGIKRDRALMSAYRTEADLSEAFVRLIGVPVQALKAAPVRFKPIHEEIARLKTEAEFFAGKPWPMSLKRRMDNVMSAIEQEQRSIAEKEAEIQRVIDRYETDLKRYRALTEAAKNAPKQ
jgi:Domain of unknown function (DUF4124)